MAKDRHPRVVLPDIIPTHTEVRRLPPVQVGDTNWYKVPLPPYTIEYRITSQQSAVIDLDISWDDDNSQRNANFANFLTEGYTATNARPAKFKGNPPYFYYRISSAEAAPWTPVVIISYITEEEYQQYIESKER